MTHFRKIWDKPKHDFLMQHREMKIADCYQLFLKTFPEAQDVTLTAFKNERSRIGAISEKYKNGLKNHNSRAPKPLFSEQIKKDYVRIKIEQPNVWMFKQHYIWWKNTGHKPEPKKETVIFLDGNIRNFDFDNLFLLPRCCIAIFNNPQLKLGLVPGNPELTRINAMNAILIHTIFNRGKELGLVSNSSGRFKSDINKYQKNKIKNLTPKEKEIQRKKRQEYFKKIKNDPERYKKYRQKRNEYEKQWRKKKSNN